MAQIIMMGKTYGEKPSKIMDIEDSYLAYCFDEVCYYYYGEVMDDKGKLRWNRIKWDDTKKGNNDELIDFIVKNGKNKV